MREGGEGPRQVKEERKKEIGREKRRVGKAPKAKSELGGAERNRREGPICALQGLAGPRG